MHRECVAIREKTHPDVWFTFNSKSLLAGELLGRKKYAEAQLLLLAGYERMKQRAKTIQGLGDAAIPARSVLDAGNGEQSRTPSSNGSGQTDRGNGSDCVGAGDRASRSAFGSARRDELW